MAVQAFIDRLVAMIYWPMLIFVAGIFMAAPVAAWTSLIAPAPLMWGIEAVGAVGALLFMALLANGAARRAINQFNGPFGSKKWTVKALFPKVGDPLFRYAFYAMLAEIAVLKLTTPLHGRYAVLLSFAGAWVACMMLFHTMKPDAKPAA
jgi:hypothetical protein